MSSIPRFLKGRFISLKRYVSAAIANNGLQGIFKERSITDFRSLKISSLLFYLTTLLDLISLNGSTVMMSIFSQQN